MTAPDDGLRAVIEDLPIYHPRSGEFYLRRADVLAALAATNRDAEPSCATEALDDEEPARADVLRLGLNAEQTAILSSLLAHRQQTVSEWVGDVMFEYGLGRPNGKDYPPPSAATPPTPASAEEERHG